nr:hypothetical protein CFP56_68268 [Quercus suber]
MGNLAEAILNGPEDKVNIWKATLKDVANISGFHLKPDRPEPEFIEEIVETIWKILYVESPTGTIPPCRQNGVPSQYSSSIIAQKEKGLFTPPIRTCHVKHLMRKQYTLSHRIIAQIKPKSEQHQIRSPYLEKQHQRLLSSDQQSSSLLLELPRCCFDF